MATRKKPVSRAKASTVKNALDPLGILNPGTILR